MRIHSLLVILVVTVLMVPLSQTSSQDDPIAIYFEPSLVTVARGQIFTVIVHIDNIPQDPGTLGVEMEIAWNETVLRVLDLEDIWFHKVTPRDEWENIWPIEMLLRANRVKYCHIWYDMERATFAGYGPIWGNHSIVALTFRAIKEGSAFLDFDEIILASSRIEDAETCSALVYLRTRWIGVGSSLFNFTIAKTRIEVEPRKIGDINNDSTIDGLDIEDFVKTFGRRFGDADYNEFADENADGVVDIYDSILIA